MTHHVQRPGTVIPETVTPGDLGSALDILGRPNTKPIAGGTDLMVELDRGDHHDVETLVDLTRIAGLDAIDSDGETVTIGPLVTHNQAVASPVLRRHGALLVQACWEIGSPQLRNRATIAGNIVTASPANDTLSALVALEAELTLRSATTERRVPISEFHRGVRKTVLAPGELLTKISFPVLDEGWRGIYLKLGLRSAQAISVVHLAAMCHLEPGPGESAQRVTAARIALGSVAPTIVRVADAEAGLIGTTLDEAAIGAAADAAQAAVSPIDDLRATADYRLDVIAEMTKRALRSIRDNTAVLAETPPLLWGQSDGHWQAGDGSDVHHALDTPVQATVNGQPVSLPGNGATVLDWLRTTGATGVKEGCAEGECGSCTIDMDGMAVLSCLIPATRAEGSEITTIEGLADRAGEGAELHRLQDAFVQTGAVQCGFCIPGFLMSGAALLDEHPEPTDDQITYGLSGNLCRCTGYYKIEDAVRLAMTPEQEQRP